jgi:hypothetical protein
MRALYAVVGVAALLVFNPAVIAQDYDGCNEQFYDSVDEPCGGGHQHAGGKRDEQSLDRARHRHRYLEAQIDELKTKLAALTKEVKALKKPAAR